MAKTISRVAVVGFGRFGQLWCELLRSDFDVMVVETNSERQAEARSKGLPVGSTTEALSTDAVFFCVPISDFEDVIEQFAQQSSSAQFIDVLSVKLHAKQVFDKFLPPHVEALLTHPMFGPDSVRVQGFQDQRIVVDQYRLSPESYDFWKSYFNRKTLHVVELTAEEHDRLAANSQGLTHFVGRVLAEIDFEPTAIDTLGAKKLLEIKTQVCNDSWQLFEDLQSLNPYTRKMRVSLADAQARVFDKLLPNRLNKNTLIVGIQGGAGSFNEEAIRYYLKRTPDTPFELKYLYTTENVLRALYEGEIDRGQFAIHNSIGGVVLESIQAIANYRFNIIEEYAIKISHALMISPKAEFDKVDTIMTHPQVLKQCKTNLALKYERLKQTSGEGDLVDHAKVAKLLSEGELPLNIATMGSRALAEIYGLQIIEENLQDLSDNFTSFMLVERPIPKVKAPNKADEVVRASMERP